jgi:hypothetical protein
MDGVCSVNVFVVTEQVQQYDGQAYGTYHEY